MSRAKFAVPPNEDPVEVVFERVREGGPGAYLVHLKDQALEVELHLDGPGRGWLRLKGRILEFHALHHRDRVEVWMEGRRYVLPKVRPGARRADAVLAPSGDVKAPMPGTVLKILAAPGDAVDVRQPLIVMESMKMEMTLTSTRKGTVARISCREGELVAMGALLMTIDEEEES